MKSRLTEREGETKRERQREDGEIFHPLIPSSDGHNSQRAAGLKPVASFWASHMDARARTRGPSSVAFPHASASSLLDQE